MKYTPTHLDLFKQISADLGRKKVTHTNVEKLLKSKGWKHNNAVRASCDYMTWHFEQRLELLED